MCTSVSKYQQSCQLSCIERETHKSILFTGSHARTLYFTSHQIQNKINKSLRGSWRVLVKLLAIFFGPFSKSHRIKAFDAALKGRSAQLLLWKRIIWSFECECSLGLWDSTGRNSLKEDEDLHENMPPYHSMLGGTSENIFGIATSVFIALISVNVVESVGRHSLSF